MLRVTRLVRPLRSGLVPAIQAGPSRIPHRAPQADCYIAIHAFFTRQASILTRPPPPPRTSRNTTTLPHRANSSSSPGEPCPNYPSPSDPSSKASSTNNSTSHAQDYTPFIRRLIHQSNALTHDSPNRPTKDELLAAAGTWWERLRIRLRWFTIRGWRRFNTDDFSAFASVFVVGNSESRFSLGGNCWQGSLNLRSMSFPALWILIGT